MDKFSELKAAAMAATPGPWEWFTSNSMARLSSTPSGKDGDVLSAFRASDGVPCVSVSQPDMAFIAAANPAVVLELLAELESKDKRLAELEQKERHSERQNVIDALAGAGESWSDIEEYMVKWDEERRKAMEAQPVAFYGSNGAYYNTSKAAIKDGCEDVTPLYTSPPAPAAPEGGNGE